MKGALVVFVKTPGLSPVKTRLAKGIGSENAKTFFVKSVKAVESIAHRILKNNDVDCHPHWAVAENDGLSHELWKNFPQVFTGYGDLGQRLYQVYSSLNKSFDYTIFLGMDSPQITENLILKTISILESYPPKFVIGPAKDGGYYLFGGSQEIPEFVFNNVTYSSNRTLFEFTENLKRLGEIEILTELSDVDTKDELMSVYSEFNDPLTKSQNILKEWMHKIIFTQQ
ncbi:MAG: glycosyltransferase [Candidatus Marinimicrobia bacterium]|jgi:hypothetical protein|nr:glycosyltransferase [Candidatus Neomarinimicrobiota bacterium]MBT3634627.1 glycosyltransferase [Candidatus Neomarinimicrobiota bacterium]MBT3682743.1 glycosyltransferase [Candidatus Neomarinimicrobiota bacterium]MBT3759602.1 glycosyltransferase [Candidatus Neomarinimicrobiota bacterium]MBT3894526.1 glycosyltransferase [Candidatus Neomarinimicrobiota bacterium]